MKIRYLWFGLGPIALQLDWLVEVRSLCLILVNFADCYNTICANVL